MDRVVQQSISIEKGLLQQVSLPGEFNAEVLTSVRQGGQTTTMACMTCQMELGLRSRLDIASQVYRNVNGIGAVLDMRTRIRQASSFKLMLSPTA